ncbi:MAG: SMI1/KNR4 family protein [Kangiellaceae bacterium]|nr:SMI1/KNR4 family protein [Kangiellaceae bacterium]
MEDVIELLRDSAQQQNYGMELPDDDLLVEIEEQLFISLPDDLRLFLLEVSDLIIGSLEPVTVTDPYSHSYLPEVAATAWDQGVPRHLIPICQIYNEEGDQFYCIEKTGEVTLWQADEQHEDTWPSIWHWAKEVWLEH